MATRPSLSIVRKKLVADDRRNLVLMNVLHGHIRQMRTFAGMLHGLDLVQARPGADKAQAIDGTVKLDGRRTDPRLMPAEIQLVLEARQKYWALEKDIEDLEATLKEWHIGEDAPKMEAREKARIQSQVLAAKRSQVADLESLSRMVGACRKVVQDSLDLASDMLSEAKDMAHKNRRHADQMAHLKEQLRAKHGAETEDELLKMIEAEQEEVAKELMGVPTSG